MKFFDTLKQLSRGRSIARIFLYDEIAKYSVEGLVLDIGGGRLADYHGILQQTGPTQFEVTDLSHNAAHKLDLESDALPFKDGEVAYALCFNVLEHIFNHRHVLAEAHRVLRPGGTLLGFAPFLVQVHPDPHDYFRYTKEALERLLKEAGFTTTEVKEIGGGPFLVSFNNTLWMFPKFLRPLAWLWYGAWDGLFVALRPQARTRYPLGYFFIAKS